MVIDRSTGQKMSLKVAVEKGIIDGITPQIKDPWELSLSDALTIGRWENRSIQRVKEGKWN